ncbi:MAG: DUF72 domain-containing protein [Candidatus Thermoplasmatota archaeon]|nr:DUF72 domain-containing protein [Candidatus Thermoplasmatota archaeon]MBS3801566.1 DUF72 domain-containing protein [Candidatus Thermoplasmatota archaeon]
MENIRIGTCGYGFYQPPNNWNDHVSELEQICEDLNLIHVVDIMRRKPVSTHSICYIRLHGLNKNEYDYNYDYSKQELVSLAEKLIELSETFDTIYCMFNNYEMYSNAKQLKKILS